MSIEKRLSDLAVRVKEVESAVHDLLTSPPWEQTEKSESPQDTSADKGYFAGRKVAFEPKIKPSPADAKQANNPWYKSWEKWKIRLEVTAIPFAIIYAVVTLLQWRDLQHNFEVEQRSWVRPNGYGHPTGSAAAIILKIINSGKSPASNITVDAGFEVLKNSEPPRLDYRPHRTVSMTAILFPGQTGEDIQIIARDRIDPHFTPDEMSALIRGVMYFVAYGQITYEHQFGKHWTRFCTWQSTPEPTATTFQSGSCVAYNTVGDGYIDPPK